VQTEAGLPRRASGPVGYVMAPPPGPLGRAAVGVQFQEAGPLLDLKESHFEDDDAAVLSAKQRAFEAHLGWLDERGCMTEAEKATKWRSSSVGDLSAFTSCQLLGGKRLPATSDTVSSRGRSP
jgi:hypothetical protein